MRSLYVTIRDENLVHAMSYSIVAPDFRCKLSLDTRKQPPYTPSRQEQVLINSIIKMAQKKSHLKGKMILAVDDEENVPNKIADAILDRLVHNATESTSQDIP